MEELYNNLMKLVTECKTSVFFYRDVTTMFLTEARIFGYYSVSEDDWELPGAYETRGIMFEMKDGKPVRIMSRPMEKFFNLNENKYTSNLDLTQVTAIADKIDGALISTYVDNGVVFAKSKSTIFGEHAQAANGLLLDYEFKDIATYALEAGLEGYTCDFEFVSPKYKIVLEYEKPQLILLGVRHNETGEYVPHSELFSNPVTRKYLAMTQACDWSDYTPEQIEEVLNDINQSEGIEGYVFYMQDGTKFKLKTDWYRALHSIQDAIDNNQMLFELILSESMDDIWPMVMKESHAIKIKKFESVYIDYMQRAMVLIQDILRVAPGSNRAAFAEVAQSKLKAAGELRLFSKVMYMFAGDSSQETIVAYIKEVFLDEYKSFVPEEYKDDSNKTL